MQGNKTPALMQGTEEAVDGDNGCLGSDKKAKAKRTSAQGPSIRYEINPRSSQLKYLLEDEREAVKAQEYEKASIRSKVEHMLVIGKRLFKYHKMRFRGLEKVHQHGRMIFVLANIFLARNRLLAA